jgi:hypothetical protein
MLRDPGTLTIEVINPDSSVSNQIVLQLVTAEN